MATIGTNYYTLADAARLQDPNGNISAIVELLSLKNSIIDDMPFIEGNLPIGHQIVQRTGLPEIYYRKLNQGIPASKSTTAKIIEQIGSAESRLEVDINIADLNGNTAQFRAGEAEAHFVAMRQGVESRMFYGSTGSSPEEFNGLSIRYSSLSAPNARNIIDGGGTGLNNTSIWLVCFSSRNGVSGIYPKGSKVGITHDHKSEPQDVLDDKGNVYRAYTDWFQWKHGLVVEDWRQAARICNIDTTKFDDVSSMPNIFRLMRKAVNRIGNLSLGRPYFYMNRDMQTALESYAEEVVKNGGQMSYPALSGSDPSSIDVSARFRNIPIHISDGLLNTESAVV
jgi:hypothetical protein